VPGSDKDGALSRALAKLDRALGQGAIDVELDAPDLLDAVRAALESGECLDISYYTASTDQTGDRTITPRRLFASEGHWYVDAWCEVADGIRRFRVDRIGAAGPARPASPEVLAEPLPDDAADSSGRGSLGAFVPGPDSRRVRIAIDPSMSWLLETIPSVQAAEEDGRRLWEVFVGGDAWLERLLLRLGPDTEVVAPREDRALAPDAARRILARYR
jgi:proteasome accessory factor C